MICSRIIRPRRDSTGDIYGVEDDEPDGSEPGNTRPYVVIQRDFYNATRLNTFLACALTTNLRRANAPENILLRDSPPRGASPKWYDDGICMSATIILLVGTSSAGKSSLARELQAIVPDHFLLLGIDDVFRMVSPRWGSTGPFSAEGFRYEYHPQEAVVTIPYGDVGRSIINGMHRAVAAFAQSGTNVIVDDMLLDHWVINDWAHTLAAYRTYIVKVQAPLSILEERELTRRNPKGLSRGHYAINDIPVFDYCVDTARVSPQEGAEELSLWLKDDPLPNAVRYYQKAF